LNVDGVEFFLDAWLKVGKSGAKFMSVSVKRKDKQPEAQQRHQPALQAAPGGRGFDYIDDESIPF